MHSKQRPFVISFAGKEKFYVKENLKLKNNLWLKNDIITIILDCDNWYIQFLKNGKQLSGKIKIVKKNIYYYPALQVYHRGSFTVIDNT